MLLEKDILVKLKNCGADFVHFVDISQLPDSQNKNFPNAILIGIVLSPDYIHKIALTPDYVEELIRNNVADKDEFHIKEKKTDVLADYITNYISGKGYSAYSQSEDNIYSTGYYNEKRKITPLPHKTIAGLAGLGWIGKHNLLISPEYGSAVSMCTVLTNVPLKTVLHTPDDSRCGDCSICKEICPVKAIKGTEWKKGIARDKLVDVFKCTSCMKCLALCPWTQKYVKKSISG